MPISSRASFLALAVPACFLLGGYTNAEAQEALWSDPATWPNGRVPGEGDAVTINTDMDVVLDVSPPTLRSLTIDGKLSFANDNDIELITDWILLHGELRIGSEAEPHTRSATITLVDNVPGENVMAMGDRGIMIMGGTLSLHGDRVHTWTKLARTAEAGSTTIEVLDASGWRAGDEIVLASTDFDFRQATKRTISAINGNVITLDQPLEYMHFGEITYGVDQRGEVGMLTRNIRIQASEDAEATYQGGHIMAMPGSEMYVSGVELHRMGQHLQLARYPIHWHLVGDAQGQYIRNSAIHDTYSRCVTVHGTDNVRVENNVTYNNVGHCFFLEDGVETGNWFVRNLGIKTRCHPTLPCIPTVHHAAGSQPGQAAAGQTADHVLLPSDNTASTFWITHPSNHYVDNVAAGSEVTGFWIALPVNGIGEFEGTEVGLNTFPRRSPLGEFRGNVAHSSFDGMMFDRGPQPNNRFSVAGSNYHTSRANPADPNSERLVTLIEDFTAYKNRHGGVWGRGELHLFRNLRLADNAIGFTHAAGEVAHTGYASRVIDSVFVGESDNIGNPRTPEEIAYGRSLPKHEAPDYPIRGYEYYDFTQEVVNTTFINYEDNDLRNTGAMSYLLYTGFGASTENSVEGLTFENAKPVYFPAFEQRWASEGGTGITYRGASIFDRDGSLGGAPGSHVVIDNGIASDTEACQIMPTWNAAICEGDFGRVAVRPAGGGGPGGGGFGGPAGGGGGPGGGGFGGPAGGGGGPGGGGAGAAASSSPITLIRNGREFVFTGGGFGGGGGETTTRSGAELKVVAENPSLNLSLRQMDKGAWLIFELPGFATASTGTAQSSLDALRSASDTSYYRGDDALWVKLVVEDPQAGGGGPGGGTNIVVSQ
jgi:cell migration-inducing and hyaluronan-binding protein